MRQLHPISPLYNKDSQVLILGSFPSVKSREQAFFYGHPQNRFWRVIAEVFESPQPFTVVKNVVPNDIGKIISDCDIKAIFVNGRTAEKYYIRYTEPIIGKKAICLPSTSPANAAWSIERLCEKWKLLREHIDIL